MNELLKRAILDIAEKSPFYYEEAHRYFLCFYCGAKEGHKHIRHCPWVEVLVQASKWPEWPNWDDAPEDIVGDDAPVEPPA